MCRFSRRSIHYSRFHCAQVKASSEIRRVCGVENFLSKNQLNLSRICDDCILTRVWMVMSFFTSLLSKKTVRIQNDRYLCEKGLWLILDLFEAKRKSMDIFLKLSVIISYTERQNKEKNVDLDIFYHIVSLIQFIVSEVCLSNFWSFQLK